MFDDIYEMEVNASFGMIVSDSYVKNVYLVLGIRRRLNAVGSMFTFGSRTGCRLVQKATVAVEFRQRYRLLGFGTVDVINFGFVYFKAFHPFSGICRTCIAGSFLFGYISQIWREIGCILIVVRAWIPFLSERLQGFFLYSINTCILTV